jgi:hypothetical protein
VLPPTLPVTRQKTKLAGIGQRWLGLERVMGIEYIADARFVDTNQ